MQDRKIGETTIFLSSIFLSAGRNDDQRPTIITRIEILRGRIEFVRKAATGPEVLRAQQWLGRSEELLALIEIVPFDGVAAKLFDGLRAATGLGKIGHADLLIASIALAHRATLVTRNLRHFQAIPRLSVENWMD